jgi:hypothetical protein
LTGFGAIDAPGFLFDALCFFAGFFFAAFRAAMRESSENVGGADLRIMSRLSGSSHTLAGCDPCSNNAPLEREGDSMPAATVQMRIAPLSISRLTR